MSIYHHPPKVFSKFGVVILCVAMLVVIVLLQTLGVYLFAPIVFADKTLGQAQLIEMGSGHGTVISLAMMFAALLTAILVFAIVSWRLKRVGVAVDSSADKHHGIKHYLAIQPFAWSVAIAIFGIWLIYLIITEILTYLLDKNPTAFMDGLYFSAEPRWLLVVVIVLVVPIYEELVFRGILWSAIASQMQGRRGIWLASIVTSVLFALIHTQYTWYEMSMVGILALIMSYARYQSGSLLLPMLIHIINNTVAMFLYISNIYS